MAIPLRYNWRSLLLRRVSNAMTLGGLALVIMVFVIVMAIVSGLDHAIRDTSSPRNMIVVRRGSTTETGSSLSLGQFTALEFSPLIARDRDGNPLASPELAEQILMPAPDGTLEDLSVRGILPIGMRIHDRVQIIAGRMFTPGLNEVIIGKGLVGRYPGFALNSRVHIGRRNWTIVGVFAADGSAFESELWGDVHSLQSDANRGAVFQSVRLTLAPGADVPALIGRIADDPRINLQAVMESDYYREQSAVASQLRILGVLIAGIMGIGAMFAAMNTMYAAVSARTTEIGTLRALGFGPAEILTAFLTESLLLALTAAVVGITLALPINFFSSTFSPPSAATLAFDFRVTLAIVAQAVGLAIILGLAGGYLPARQAMRMSVASALRRS